MNRKFMLLVEVLGAITLALVGLLGNPGVTRAAMPLPIQPWGYDTDIRLSSSTLGALVVNESVSTGPWGVRIAGSYWYNSGLQTPPDKEMVAGAHGGLIAWYDLFCNASGPSDLDTLALNEEAPPIYHRIAWDKAPTALIGTADAWLLTAGPPYATMWRLHGLFDVFYTSTGTKVGIPAGGIHVNLMGYTFPWATKLAMTYVVVGSLGALPSQTCTDPSSSSNSHIIGVFYNPVPEGDSGAPCTGTGCADKQIHGFWSQGRVQLAADGTTTIPVTKRVLNNGPAEGDFTDILDVEVPPALSVEASLAPAVLQSHWDGSAWVADPPPTVTGSGALISFPETDLEVSVPIQYIANLTLTCKAAGDYLVTLKDFTYPQAGTQDNDLSSNVALQAIRVICGSPAATATDLRIIELRKTLLTVAPIDGSHPNENLALPQTGEHVQLVSGQTATVAVDSTEINLSDVAVNGLQTFTAEAPPGIIAEWAGGGSSVQFTQSHPPGTPGAGNGQIDVIRNLNITCSTSGIYPVAVKVIDMPVGVGETKPADNVRSNIIKVWCFANHTAKAASDDGIDDGSALVVRWTLLQPRTDVQELRKTFDKNNPLALRSEDRYGERSIDLQCFFDDTNGAPNRNGDVFTDEPGTPPIIEAWESNLDPQRPYGLDDDGDCLGDPMFTQPSHPVDELDSLDTDGDGVSDVIETLLGSNPAVLPAGGLPAGALSQPEANLGGAGTLHATCTDLADNDGDTTTDTDAQCVNADGDADGWANWFEDAAGSDKTVKASTPENLAAPTTCDDGVDNDSYQLTFGGVIHGDGKTDGTDTGCIEPGVALCSAVAPTSIGAIYNHNIHNDEDCDGLLDGIEKAWGSNPKLVDSDSDFANDWVEMAAFSNPVDPDTDADGLLDKPDDDYQASPYGGAQNSVPEATIAGNCSDGKDNDQDGMCDVSGCTIEGLPEIADPGCATLDSDGDTKTDADERGLDSNPNNECMDQYDNDSDGGYVNDGCPQVGLAKETNCINNLDDDWDGRINDGCAQVGATAESNTTGVTGAASKPEGYIAGNCADGVDNDKDGITDGFPPNSRCPSGSYDSDGDTYSDSDENGLGSVAITEYGEVANSDDNCPYVYNPDQANNDGHPQSNGPFLAGAFRSNPTGDALGDACDTDDDNDRAYDAAELQSLFTDPYNPDTNNNRCADGVESMLGYDPASPTAKCLLMQDDKQTLFRTCHINQPDSVLYPLYTAYMGVNSEYDPDNDGVTCPYAPSGAPSGDYDADNGASAYKDSCAGAKPCAEVEDAMEIKGYNTVATVSDTDGDVCEDWCEITDINGDRACTGLDRVAVIGRVFDKTSADPVSDAIYDVNKDQKINTQDGVIVAVNSSLVKPPGATHCKPGTGLPNPDLQRQLP